MYALLNSLRVFSFTAAMELFRLRVCVMSFTVDIADEAATLAGLSALINVAKHIIINRQLIRSSKGNSRSSQNRGPPPVAAALPVLARQYQVAMRAAAIMLPLYSLQPCMTTMDERTTMALEPMPVFARWSTTGEAFTAMNSEPASNRSMR